MKLQQLEKLSSDDVERVLQFQRKHGACFGEAIEHLGLVNGSSHVPQPKLKRSMEYIDLPREHQHYPPELVAVYHAFSDEVEVLRAVHDELMVRWFSGGHRALTIASVDPDEDTRFISANLAVVFSQFGSNTLLIDANLHDPRQHKIFNTDNSSGLSTLLRGQAGSEVIERIDDFADLSLLPAGPKACETRALVSYTNFGAMREKFTAHFGVTLVDAPPFSLGGEAIAIAACTGGVLLIARKHKTRAVDINAITAQITRVDSQVIGSILLES